MICKISHDLDQYTQIKNARKKDKRFRKNILVNNKAGLLIKCYLTA
jgi:hypothetical protein